MKESPLMNVMEEIVSGIVGFLLRGSEYQTFCRCYQCELDTMAVALNALPPKYVASIEERNRVFKELNTPEIMDGINKKIIHAIHVVGKNPRH